MCFLRIEQGTSKASVMWLKRNENFVLNSISFLIFIVCLFVCIYSTYSCLDKWLASPIGTKLSAEFQTKVDLPIITFCPEYGGILFRDRDVKPMAFNWTKLDECDLKNEDEFSSTSQGCQDPKTLWENMTPNFDDFGFRSALVKTYADEGIDINLEKPDANWHRVVSSMFGACYSFTMPEEIKKKGIEYIDFFMKKNHSLNIFFHGKGVFNLMNPWQTMDYIDQIVTFQESYNVILDYQHNEMMDFDGEECQTDPMYSFEDCVQDEILKVCTIIPIFVYSIQHVFAYKYISRIAWILLDVPLHMETI